MSFLKDVLRMINTKNNKNSSATIRAWFYRVISIAYALIEQSVTTTQICWTINLLVDCLLVFFQQLSCIWQLTGNFNLVEQYGARRDEENVDTRSTIYLKFFARKCYLIGERMFCWESETSESRRNRLSLFSSSLFTSCIAPLSKNYYRQVQCHRCVPIAAYSTRKLTFRSCYAFVNSIVLVPYRFSLKFSILTWK